MNLKIELLLLILLSCSAYVEISGMKISDSLDLVQCPPYVHVPSELCDQLNLPYHIACKKDKDCQYGEKCCLSLCQQKFCQYPMTTTTTHKTITKPAGKRGFCPKPQANNDLDCSSVSSQCKTDKDCPGKLKCCLWNCNQYACINPAISVHLRCPSFTNYSESVCAHMKVPNNCNSNLDCEEDNEKRCCPGPCDTESCKVLVEEYIMEQL